MIGDNDEEPLGTRPDSGENNPLNSPQNPPLRRVLTLISTEKRTPRTTLKTKNFRKKFYQGVPNQLWNDWHWQVGNRIRSFAQLKTMLDLSAEEIAALSIEGQKLPVGITPYYMSLLSQTDPLDPLRRTMIPTLQEMGRSSMESEDPLGEDTQSPVPGLVHRYPDRVLLMVHDFCAAYCRYCTRSRTVGHGKIFPDRRRLESAFDYIRSKKTIRDVVVSGGDPLMVGDDRIDWILTQLRHIPHVEIIRLGTKVPAVLPQRITPKFVKMLQRHHPLWMSLHFTHPNECTPESYRACGMLADAGIPLGSQTVLLKGINDSVDTMKSLVHHLMRMRVRPYYLYQCDPIVGSSHFRTSLERGLDIVRGLRGFTSGYAIPHYVVDIPGGGGKIPLSPDYVYERKDKELVLQNYEGKTFRYPNPTDETMFTAPGTNGETLKNPPVLVEVY
jgi:lysine 2,3-aminomutase